MVFTLIDRVARFKPSKSGKEALIKHRLKLLDEKLKASEKEKEKEKEEVSNFYFYISLFQIFIFSCIQKESFKRKINS